MAKLFKKRRERTDYKQEYYEIIKPYFDAGIMKEIYNSDYLSICNIANHEYGIFLYSLLKEGRNNFFGIAANAYSVKQVVKDNKTVFELFDIMEANVPDKSRVYLTPENFKIMSNAKKKADAEGPTDLIDLDMEARLLKQKNKPEKYR